MYKAMRVQVKNDMSLRASHHPIQDTERIDNAVAHSRKREYSELDVANCSHLDISSKDLTQRN